MVDTIRSISALQALLADNTSGDISPQDIRDLLVSLVAGTGWGAYDDTQYTDLSPLSLVADTDTVLPNNAGNTIETQKPGDVAAFYDGSVITGRDGDGLLITVDFVATPTSPSATALEVWVDIGGSVGELYRRIVTFPKGTGVERPINFSTSAYTLNTWETNGATVYVRANGPVDIHSIRYVLTRTHKAVN